MFLIEKTKVLQSENAALKAANAELTGKHREIFFADHDSGEMLEHIARKHTKHTIAIVTDDDVRSCSIYYTSLGTLPRHLIPPFLPPLQNVEAFSSLLGEEIATTYAKVFKSNDASERLALSTIGGAGVANAGASPSRPTSADDAKSTRSDSSPCESSATNNDEPKNKSPVRINLLNNDSGRSPSVQASLEKLQECLRRNVERYLNEALNTMNISRCVRELLSVHNIGQRLFAKYVLGLSQGTVSELLSKPKPWDKLTEKGRDSYRKMHAWAADDNCIYLLKSLVPRKGKNGS